MAPNQGILLLGKYIQSTSAMTLNFTNLNLTRDIPLLCFAAHTNEESFKQVIAKFPSSTVIFFGDGDSSLIQKYNYGLLAGDIPEERLPSILNRSECLIYYPPKGDVNLELVNKAELCGCKLELNDIAINALSKKELKPSKLISIILIADGEESKIISSLKSALTQSYPALEIILVDESEEYKFKYITEITEYKNVKYVHKQFGGTADSKNIGIASSLGEWILTLPIGDLLKANAISLMVEATDNHPNASIISSNTVSISGVSKTHEPNIINLTSSKTLPDATLIKKSLWEEIGGFYEGLVVPVENWAFWIAAVRNNVEIQILDEPLIYTRTPSNNLPYQRAVVHSLFPDLFDIPIILEAHESLKLPDEILKEVLLERISRFPWLTLPWMWLGLIEEALGSHVRAAKSYIRSVKNSGEENWQAMIRLHIISALLAKNAEEKGETFIAEERSEASEEFLEVAHLLINEREKILAPDWPKPRA